MLFKNALVRRIEKALDPAELSMLLEQARAEGKLTDGTLRGLKLDQVMLRGLNLSAADLRGAELPRVDLRGADLTNARLNDVDFSGANLSEVNFTGADLTNAILLETDLSGAIITPAQLARTSALADAKMPDGTPYDGRYLLPYDLKMAADDDVYPDDPEWMAEWLGVSQETYDTGQAWAAENLREARVESAYQLAGPPNDWAGEARADGSLSDGSLRGVDLRHEDLMLNDFRDAVLPGALMVRVQARRADFSGANLEGADLSEGNLLEARFVGANLRNALLEAADLDEANFENADLTGADLFDAVLIKVNLTGAKITEEQLVQADSLRQATMPDGTLYDGRYDLEGDMADAEDSGLDVTNLDEMAYWFGVEVNVYESARLWAKMNLPRLRPD
jgi:uncharacterized protein YjbI with pentapeptide repeats